MKCIKLFFICIFIFSCNCFSQDNLKDIPAKDSTNNFDSVVKEELQFKNFFRNNSKKLMGKDDLLGLELYKKAVNDSSLVLNPYKLSYFSKDELTSFKKSFSLIMELAEKDRNKYDLGVVSKYLGISQKVMAIILAILSVAK